MSEFPSDWEVTNLGDLATIKASNVDKKIKEGQRDVLLCNYMDVFKNPVVSSSLEFMKSTASEKEISEFSLSRGDVLLTKDSEVPEEIGIPSVITDDISNLVCGYHLYMIRADHSRINPEYLCWTLRSNSSRQYFYQMANGSTRFGLNLKHVEECPVAIPPLPEQKKIAEILSGIDKQIFANERQLEKNQRLSKGVLSGILARFKEESRDSTRLVEDIFFETSTPETHDSETPLYSLTIEFGLVPKPDRYVRDFLLTDKEKENYKLITMGDFVMNPMNLRWGAISAFHKESSAKISKYYTTFRARDDRTSVRFYEFLFCSDQYLRLYERIATGSLIEKMRVHWSAFKKLEIPFPSLEEQINFESISSSLELTSSRTKDFIAKLKIFRSAVSSDLLSGRKRVSI